MKRWLNGTGAVLFSLIISCAGAAALDEWDRENLTCRPVNGTVQLPGITFDDLTPLARELFRSNPAAVTNALYALPASQRDDFLALYLEPGPRERHRYFFARCREYAVREAVGNAVLEGDLLPAALRRELQRREEVRRPLWKNAPVFHAGTRAVLIPVPDGFSPDDGSLGSHLNDFGMTDRLAVFGKTSLESRRSRPQLAAVNFVRETGASPEAVLRSYRTLVDRGWRVHGVWPEGSEPETAERVDYRWNLEPFAVSDHSFCYGQFEKTSGPYGTDSVIYRGTAVIMLPDAYAEVGLVRDVGAGLEQVEEINVDLIRWRDAILEANMPVGSGR